MKLILGCLQITTRIRHNPFKENGTLNVANEKLFSNSASNQQKRCSSLCYWIYCNGEKSMWHYKYMMIMLRVIIGSLVSWIESALSVTTCTIFIIFRSWRSLLQTSGSNYGNMQFNEAFDYIRTFFFTKRTNLYFIYNGILLLLYIYVVRRTYFNTISRDHASSFCHFLWPHLFELTRRD